MNRFQHLVKILAGRPLKRDAEADPIKNEVDELFEQLEESVKGTPYEQGFEKCRALLIDRLERTLQPLDRVEAYYDHRVPLDAETYRALVFALGEEKAKSEVHRDELRQKVDAKLAMAKWFVEKADDSFWPWTTWEYVHKAEAHLEEARGLVSALKSDSHLIEIQRLGRLIRR